MFMDYIRQALFAISISVCGIHDFCIQKAIIQLVFLSAFTYGFAFSLTPLSTAAEHSHLLAS